MSDTKYQAGIRAGISGSISAGSWPLEVPGLGPMRGGRPLGKCARCPIGAHPFRSTTHVCYGETYLCKSHALEGAEAGA